MGVGRQFRMGGGGGGEEGGRRHLHARLRQQIFEAMHEGRHDIVIQSPPPGCPRAIYAIMVDCW